MKIDAILDSTIVIDLLRSHLKAVAWQGRLGRTSLAITPVVWMETVQGATNKVERARAIRFLRRFRLEHPTPADNQWAMLQLAQFHLSHGVELADVMIASVAVRLSVPLYTLNLKHYVPLLGLGERQPY